MLNKVVNLRSDTFGNPIFFIVFSMLFNAFLKLFLILIASIRYVFFSFIVVKLEKNNEVLQKIAYTFFSFLKKILPTWVLGPTRLLDFRFFPTSTVIWTPRLFGTLE